MNDAQRSKAQRLITVIRNRAFDELERERGELAPMALTTDDAGRIGVIAVYTGDAFPNPDNALVDLTVAVRAQIQAQSLAGAATANYERVTLTRETGPVDAVCVRFETRDGPPLRIYFPYTIKKKLRGSSEITTLPPVTMPGTNSMFPAREERGKTG